MSKIYSSSNNSIISLENEKIIIRETIPISVNLLITDFDNYGNKKKAIEFTIDIIQSAINKIKQLNITNNTNKTIFTLKNAEMESQNVVNNGLCINHISPVYISLEVKFFEDYENGTIQKALEHVIELCQVAKDNTTT